MKIGIFNNIKQTSLTIIQEKRRLQQIFIIPLIVTLIVMILIPLLALFVFSLTSSKVGFSNFRFIGFENYIEMFQSGPFWDAVIVTFLLLAGTIFFQLVFYYISYHYLIFL